MVEGFPPRRSRRRLQALAFLYATVGGLVAVGLLVAGLTWSAVAIGLVVTLGLARAGARRSPFDGALRILLAYAFAFGVFVWPALLLVAVALLGDGR